MTRTTPCRRTILHLLHIRLTDDLTFILYLETLFAREKDHKAKALI